MLNKSKGQMYPWVTHTWNVIKGKCPHDCSYCYMKRYPQSELHFDEKELKTDLGSSNTIFVGSSCDMWVNNIHVLLTARILSQCASFNNSYLFQSKNPEKFLHFSFPPDTILGTTIETNRHYPQYMRYAPPPQSRMVAMLQVEGPKMVSIEPIMDFDITELTKYIRLIKPQFVSIGADSGNNHLLEPSGDKVEALIEGLKGFTEVKIKDNLKRLM